MLTFKRRLFSTLVKSDAAAALSHAETNSSFYQISSYETKNLQDYMDKNGIMFPVETLIEKYQQRDYEFFLAQ